MRRAASTSQPSTKQGGLLSKPPPTSTKSSLTLFLTNLRLLDLDRYLDWPGIESHTFSSKDGVTNQRHRIRCAEWALFRLYEVWDPEETRNKLKPFFPPLEPLQSLNLRAALFRCLSELKKGGHLGRDTVLRKTMLDECKGERFEDILFIFSTIVLKKSLLARGEYERTPSIARRLAMADHLKPGDHPLIDILKLAYTWRQTGDLSEKRTLKSRYQDFASLLRLHELRSARREEQLQATQEGIGDEDAISASDSETLTQELRVSWSGPTRWLDTILDGKTPNGSDSVFDRPFEKVWDYAARGDLSALETPESHNLFEDLESRVRLQRRRLDDWKDFRTQLAKRKQPTQRPREGEPSVQPDCCVPPVVFDRHQSIQIRNPSSPSKPSAAPPNASAMGDSVVGQELWTLIESMQSELAAVGTKRRHPQRGRGETSWFAWSRRDREETNGPASRAKADGLPEDGDENPADKHGCDDSDGHEGTGADPQGRDSQRQGSANGLVSPKDSSADLRNDSAMVVAAQLEPMNDTLRKKEGSVSPSSTKANEPSLSPSDVEDRRPPKKSGTHLRNARLSLLGKDEQELLAEQMVANMTGPQSSPAQPETLLERTRASMATSRTQKTVFPTKNTLPKLRNPPGSNNAEQDGMDDGQPLPSLAQRTRQSMSFRQSPHQDRRRAKARHPPKSTTRLTTPPQQLSHGSGELGNPTSREDIFDHEADYASVFKSRPKIKLSPTVSPSPVRREEWSDDEEEEARLEAEWESSPLSRLVR
ncbi:MAG: hypothetical protein M1833_004105 [Piccolia ochrophora]|nr:MAG: hypothetical protein M1833_004105 [Piccolia ochrophora]